MGIDPPVCGVCNAVLPARGTCQKFGNGEWFGQKFRVHPPLLRYGARFFQAFVVVTSGNGCGRPAANSVEMFLPDLKQDRDYLDTHSPEEEP